MNKVILIGRLAKDVELRNTSNGIPVVKFPLAVSREYKNNEGNYDTDFINILVWRKQAELCSEYLEKGDKIAVVGNIQTGNYINNEGKKIYTFDVIAENIHFLESKQKEKNKEIDKHDDEPYKEIAQEISQESLPF